ncbi:MAG TPA: N-acetyltransferase [Burkholderiaceae bacterium]|jgi:ribosomal-protein-alanine N-acetyltransferase
MTPDLQVSLATRHDAAKIAALSRDLIEQGLPWSWRPERVARAIAAANTNVAVLREARDEHDKRDKGELDAFGIMEYWDDDAHLVLFAVRPLRQRHGIGSALLQWLEASALVAGSKRIRVEARRDNTAARSFYNEHGYHELQIRPRMYSGVLDGILLEKWLGSSEPDVPQNFA